MVSPVGPRPSGIKTCASGTTPSTRRRPTRPVHPGGQRRRRESTLAGAYDVEGLTSTGEIRRLLEVAAYDTLALESSVPRSRALVAIALAAGKLLETGELEERIAHLEAAVQDQSEPPVFPAGED